MNKSVKAVYISVLKSSRESFLWRHKHLETVGENLEYTDLIGKIKKIRLKGPEGNTHPLGVY